ncbi:TonB-dependent receptor [Novosphingobium sp. 9U]|uniref:TonB-dependent receptor n=1 Tax=Novosphingobium sp. 9U TaxID=2653158 RepID=UPI0012F0B64D|nr:TonB-dependent receptor [Novosphingobium sp. 9U]VWX55058.1 Outer membrane receptor protein involved in Fe transport [Novosphingobium sp. 9U]
MRNLLISTAVVALITSGPALAQEDPFGPAVKTQDGSATNQGEILVTARRREESIRDVPGTIAAVTAEQLEAKGPVVGTADLLNTTPGVRFNDVASENLAELSIRGSGTQRATSADSGVGLFVNGAYVGSSTLGGRNFKTLDYFDLERVEVLQGPQGGLYGRNSEFGVVNIVLAKPAFRNSGYVRDIFTTEQNQNRLAAVVNQKVSDTVAMRIGGETYGQTKGFYYDPANDKYYDRTSGWTARGQIRYRSGPLDATLLIDAQDLDLPSFVNSLVVPGGGVNPQLPKGFVQSRFVIPHSGQDGLQQKQQRVMLLADYDLSFAKLTSTTMATRWRSSQQFAAAVDLATEIALQQSGQLGIYPYGQTTTDVKDRTFYQDLHLAGSADEGRLSWLLGAEALVQRDKYRRVAVTSPCTFRLGASLCTGTPAAPVCIKPLATSPACPTPFPNAFGTDNNTRQRVNSFAGYASLQYTAGPVTISGEGRYSHDTKRSALTVYSLYTTRLVGVPTSFLFKADQPTWTVTASYKTSDATQTLLYAKVGTGYRAGAVNNGTFNAAAPNPFVSTYDNENTTSYEAGIKSNLLPNLFVRASAYLSRTTDAITSINDGCTTTNACGTAQQLFNVNGGTIHARGFEVAADGNFEVGTGRLSFAVNASNQHAVFHKVPTGIAGLPTQGSKVAQVPDWTISANVNFRQPIADELAGFVNVNWSGQRGGGQDTVTLATPYIPMSDFDIFGARAGLDYKQFQFALFLRNFTDQEVEVLKFQQAGYPLSVRYNKPRTFGGSISYRW